MTPAEVERAAVMLKQYNACVELLERKERITGEALMTLVDGDHDDEGGGFVGPYIIIDEDLFRHAVTVIAAVLYDQLKKFGVDMVPPATARIDGSPLPADGPEFNAVKAPDDV